MAKAIFNGVTVAESDDTVVVEGNHYFPISAVADGVLSDNDRSTVCPWKGTASYYDVTAGGSTGTAAAFYYAEPKEAAAQIKDRVAFWGDVNVEV